jgi:hypothetical protein
MADLMGPTVRGRQSGPELLQREAQPCSTVIRNEFDKNLKSFVKQWCKGRNLEYKGIVPQELLQRIVKMKKTELYSSIKSCTKKE